VAASLLMGFGMTGRMAVVQTVEMVFYESLNRLRLQIVQAMENMWERTTNKYEINGDDCGRGRDNGCI
jgi:hypothetical protein